MRRLLFLAVLLLALASSAATASASDTTEDNRPTCYFGASDFKQGPDDNADGKPDRFGSQAGELCTGEMYYLGANGYMQRFKWDCWCWSQGQLIGGGADRNVAGHTYTTATGYGPIPPFHGINGRRLRAVHMHAWFDFSTPKAVPGEGLRFHVQFGDGEWW